MDRLRKRMTRTLNFGKGSKNDKNDSVQGTSYTPMTVLSPTAEVAPLPGSPQMDTNLVDESVKPIAIGAVKTTMAPPPRPPAPLPPVPPAVENGHKGTPPEEHSIKIVHDQSITTPTDLEVTETYENKEEDDLIQLDNFSVDSSDSIELADVAESPAATPENHHVRVDTEPPEVRNSDEDDEVTSGSPEINFADDESEASLSELLDEVVEYADQQLRYSSEPEIDWTSDNDGTKEPEAVDDDDDEFQIRREPEPEMELEQCETEENQIEVSKESGSGSVSPTLTPPQPAPRRLLLSNRVDSREDLVSPPSSGVATPEVDLDEASNLPPSSTAEGTGQVQSQEAEAATSLRDDDVDSFPPAVLKLTLRMFSVPFDRSFSRDDLVEKVKGVVNLYATVQPADEVLAISRPIRELDDLLLRMALKKNVHKCRNKWELLHLAMKMIRASGDAPLHVTEKAFSPLGLEQDEDQEEDENIFSIQFIQDIDLEEDIDSLPVDTLKHILFVHDCKFDDVTTSRERLIRKVKKEWRYYNSVLSASLLTESELEALDEKQLRESLLVSVDKCRTKDELIRHIRKFRSDDV